MERVAVGTSVTFRYVIVGGNGVVAIYSRASGQADVLHYVLTDNQGSVDSFVDGATLSVTSASFSAFGMRRNAATWSGDPTNRAALDAISRQGFTYQTVLGSMGLNHMNGRVQDATTGSFLSADPFISDPGNTQNYGRYTYVYDNPLSNVDPSGFVDCMDGEMCSPGADMQTVLVQAFRCNDRCWMIVSAFEQGIIDRILFSLSAIPSLPGTNVDQKHDTDNKDSDDQNKCHRLGWFNRWMPHGIGGGVAGEGEIGAGRGFLRGGTGGQLSEGWGMFGFNDRHEPLSQARFTSGGVATYNSGWYTGAPHQESEPWIAGASLGGGAYGFLTNAVSPQQLSGPFETYSLNVGVGPAQFSIQASIGEAQNGTTIWQLNLSPPLAGETAGLSASKMTTTTEVKPGGCH